MKQLYKVLDKGMISPFQNFQYKLKKWYICKDFNTDPNIDCSKGFYAVDIDGLPYTFNINKNIYLVEVDGLQVEIDQFKRRYEKIRLIKKISFKEIKNIIDKENWNKKIDYNIKEALFPYNPLRKERKKVTKQEIELLKQWASVGDSVRTSVWDSVWASVWASVGAYIGSLFPNIKKWKYIEHQEGIYPFQSAVDLWYRNLVPSFDGETWRLHIGKNAKIIYEWNK